MAFGSRAFAFLATDILSKQYGFGEALGGLILLAIATNLPEIAITATGAIKGDVSVAVGNILGGIALQTVVLVILDVCGMGRKIGLTYSASSIDLVLEGVIVMAVALKTSVRPDSRRSRARLRIMAPLYLDGHQLRLAPYSTSAYPQVARVHWN